MLWTKLRLAACKGNPSPAFFLIRISDGNRHLLYPLTVSGFSAHLLPVHTQACEHFTHLFGSRPWSLTPVPAGGTG